MPLSARIFIFACCLIYGFNGIDDSLHRTFCHKWDCWLNTSIPWAIVQGIFYGGSLIAIFWAGCNAWGWIIVTWFRMIFRR